MRPILCAFVLLSFSDMCRSAVGNRVPGGRRPSNCFKRRIQQLVQATATTTATATTHKSQSSRSCKVKGGTPQGFYREMSSHPPFCCDIERNNCQLRWCFIGELKSENLMSIPQRFYRQILWVKIRTRAPAPAVAPAAATAST